MFHRHVELYLHFIWSTWDRHPWIEESMQPRLHAVLASIAREKGCSFAVAGGIGEHVHMLVRAPATSCPADLVRDLKGVSSRFAHTELCVDPSFNWSQGYALFSRVPANAQNTVSMPSFTRPDALGSSRCSRDIAVRAC
jgi:putative transposase